MRPIGQRWVECCCLSMPGGGSVQNREARENLRNAQSGMGMETGGQPGSQEGLEDVGFVLCVPDYMWLCADVVAASGGGRHPPISDLELCPCAVKPRGASGGGMAAWHTPPPTCRDCSPMRWVWLFQMREERMSQWNREEEAGPATVQRQSSCAPWAWTLEKFFPWKLMIGLTEWEIW